MASPELPERGGDGGELPVTAPQDRRLHKIHNTIGRGRRPDPRRPGCDGTARALRQRSGRNAARTSSAKRCGTSQAGKWPPLPASLKYASPGYTLSTKVRGAAQISPGNVVNPT